MKTVNENFLLAIAKLLVLPSVIKNLDKADKLLKSDPQMLASIETAKYNLDLVRDRLPDFCKRHPNFEYCKKVGRKDK